MENKNNFKIGMFMVACLLIGAIAGRSSPISNSSKNDNSSKVFVTQEIPENSGKLLKNPEKSGKIRKIVNINKDDFATIKNELKGIGSKKAKEIISRREKEPFTSIYQLLEEGIVGVESFEKNRDYMVVGD